MSFKAGSIYGEAILDTKKWESGIKTIGKSSLNVAKVATAAFVGAMTVSIAKANEFQKSMSNVSTVVDTSVVSTQDMTKSLIALDPALGTTTDLTNALYQTFSAGAEDAAEAIETTTAAATFAGAALTDTATAVDVLTTASNAYGKEVVSTTEASDIFFTTIKQGKITGEQLAGTIGKSIPLFASMNIPLEELGAGMAAMTKQGVNASESTTQLNGIINSFLKPSADMKAALEAQGIASGSALLESEGLSGALAFLETASGGSKDELSKLLPSIEAVRGTLALTGTGGKEFANILKEMEDSTGATDIAFGKQEKTFETLKNQMDKVAIVSGNIGKFFVDDIAGGATEAAGGMLTFLMSSSGMETVGNIAGAVAGTFEVLKEQISPLVDIIKTGFSEAMTAGAGELEDLGLITGSGSGAFELLGFAVSGVTSVFRLASVATVETIGMFGDLVEAVLASGATVGSFFKMLTGKATWDDVKENALTARESFANLGTGIKDSFSTIATAVVSEVDSFSERAAFQATQIESTFTLAFDKTKTNVVGSWDEMLTGQTAVIDQMLESGQELVDGLADQNESVEEDTEETAGFFAQLWKDTFEGTTFSMEGFYDSMTAAGSFALDALSSTSDLYFESEQNKIDLWKDGQLTALQERYDQGLISKEEYELGVKEIDDQALADSNELAKKQFQTKKALDISNAWMDAASSIMGWWSVAGQLGPIAGPIFAGIMTGVTLGVAGTQTGLIASQSFIPAKQTGGMASGMTRINEAGGEIVSLPDGSQVIPNDISRQIANNSGGGGNVVNFYGTVIKDDIDINRMADMISRKISKRTKVS